MLQLNALSRGFDGLKWVIDDAPVTILLIFLQRCIYFVLIPPALQQYFSFAWTQTTGEFLFRPTLTVPGVCIFDMEEVTQRFPFHLHTQRQLTSSTLSQEGVCHTGCETDPVDLQQHLKQRPKWVPSGLLK